jgi:peptidoglycan/LPS O-acetylase OafA/YrhL
LLTWLQPLPLLFFAAGAAARYDLVRHPDQPGWRFAGVRLLRMARPVAVLAGVWVALLVALPAAGVPEGAVERVARIVPQPLWFLGVQLGLLALTPLLLRALRRWGAARVLLVAAALPVVVDLLRFSDEVALPGAPNILLVWAVPYLGGLVYAERRLRPVPRRDEVPERTVLALLAAFGLGVTVLLLVVGPYPVSLIGMPGDALSNLAPPTAPVVGFAVAQVAAALLVRDALARWAERSRVVAWVGARSMGLYLWHLTAMFAVAGVVLLGVGEVLPEPWTWDWWTSRAAYLGAAGVVLAGLVAGAARLERVTAARPVGR